MPGLLSTVYVSLYLGAPPMAPDQATTHLVIKTEMNNVLRTTWTWITPLTALETITMISIDVIDWNLLDFCKIVKILPSVSELRIVGCWLNDTTGIELLLSQLTELDLSNNGLLNPAVCCLLDNIPSQCPLRVLRLASNGLTDECAKSLPNLAKCDAFRELDMWGNDFGPATGAAIGALLATCSSFVKVNAHGTPPSLWHALRDQAKVNWTIQAVRCAIAAATRNNLWLPPELWRQLTLDFICPPHLTRIKNHGTRLRARKKGQTKK
jgi:hypothetical protein